MSNISLGEDFYLKLQNFEFSVTQTYTEIVNRGTKNFRSHDLKSRQCKNPLAADIYSLGVIFFVMMAGVLPYEEDGDDIEGFNLYDMVLKGDWKTYWRNYEEFHPDIAKLDKGFKAIFEKMLDPDPERRPGIEEIRENPFFKGEVYTKVELKVILDHRLRVGKHINEWKKI